MSYVMKTVEDLKEYLKQFPDTTLLAYRNRDGYKSVSFGIDHTMIKDKLPWDGKCFPEVECLLLDFE